MNINKLLKLDKKTEIDIQIGMLNLFFSNMFLFYRVVAWDAGRTFANAIFIYSSMLFWDILVFIPFAFHMYQLDKELENIEQKKGIKNVNIN